MFWDMVNLGYSNITSCIDYSCKSTTCDPWLTDCGQVATLMKQQAGSVMSSLAVRYVPRTLSEAVHDLARPLFSKAFVAASVAYTTYSVLEKMNKMLDIKTSSMQKVNIVAGIVVTSICTSICN